MTGGAQTWVHASFPGARFVGQGVAYVCACGRTVVGKSRDKKVQKERTIANYACSSYEQVRRPCTPCLARPACRYRPLLLPFRSGLPYSRAAVKFDDKVVWRQRVRTMPQRGGVHAQVCGEGEGIVGDAVVPLQSALLEGAEHVVLDGVFHSMSRVGTFDTDSGAAAAQLHANLW